MLAFLLVFGLYQMALAQENDPTWSSPVNLSQSGSADTPSVAVAPDGTVLAVWQDEFDGPVYARRTGDEWSLPQAVAFPFGTFVPFLLVDPAGTVHAFWIGEENGFYYSRTKVDTFGTTTWSGSRLMDTSVIAFDVVLDAENQLNVSYVRNLGTVETPAGVYFQRSVSDGATWLKPVLLYQSTYLRQLSAEEIKLDLLFSPNDPAQPSLYVLWDNRPRKQMFMARSGDNGETWNAPLELRGPESASAAPHAVGFTLVETQLLVLWQERLSDTNCRQYYQTFALTGEAISAPQTMLSKFPICPENNQLVTSPGQFTLLQTSLLNLNYLLAWDGTTWSDPQLQQELSNFVDPDTLEALQLECLHLLVGTANELLTIGCDTNSGGDIWVTSRHVEELSAWFSVASSWGQPASLFTTDRQITSLSMTADQEGQFHAVWAQTTPDVQGTTELYYARWSDEHWSYIVPILSPPLGHAENLVTAIDRAGKLFVVWSGGQVGEIYFSWANANLAGNPSEWATPILLPMPRAVGASPSIVVKDDGELFVAYTIPINENRGVYLTRSTDGGQTWSEVTQIVDGITSGWETLGNTLLSLTSAGHLQVLFWRFPPPGGIDPRALLYSYSEDHGQTWSVAEEVAYSEITTSWLESLGDVTYRVWQEEKDNISVTFLETSLDGGQTWTEPINFSDFAPGPQVSDVVLDSSGRLHLIQLIEDDKNGVVLQEWIWEGRQWLKEDRTILVSGMSLEGLPRLEASITSNGELGVLIANQKLDPLALDNDIIFTRRTLDQTPAIVVATPVPVPTLAGTVPPAVDATPTATPEAAATQVSERPPATSTLDSNLLGPVVGFAAAGLMIVVAFVLFSKLANRNAS